MLKNYVIVAFRNLKRNKVYTLINVLGLSVGIAIGIIIFLIVNHEFTYDNFHSNKIYRVVANEDINTDHTSHTPSVPYPMAATLRIELPENAKVTGMHFSTEEQIEIGNDRFNVENVVFADHYFFDVFDFEMISGQPNKALAQPNRVLISSSFAKKHFPGEDPIGKIVKLAGVVDLEIAGVVKDAPSNSHLSYNLIVSYKSFTKEFIAGFPTDIWGLNFSGYCYLHLPPGYQVEDVNKRLEVISNKYPEKSDAGTNEYLLQPMEDIHFNQMYSDSTFIAAEKNYLLIWIGIGIFILVIACINFINLSTALSVKRSKEVGVRKVLGAERSHLMRQFLGETLLITIISLLIALGLVEWITYSFSEHFTTSIALDLVHNPSHLLLLAGILVIVTILSGFYPSMILGSFKPVEVLKSKLPKLKGSSISLRQGLVVFQFIIAQLLIIGTLVIAQQINYFTNKPLGFTTEAIITVPLFSQEEEIQNRLKTRLLNHKNIENVTFGLGAPIANSRLGTSYKVDHGNGPIEGNTDVKLVDKDFSATYNLKMKAGEWFNRNKIGVDTNALIINETAVKIMGFASAEDAIGKQLNVSVNNTTAPIIGVTEDFHNLSFHKSINAVVLMQMPALYYQAGIKINTQNLEETLTFLEEEWSNTFPEFMFEYSFLEDQLQLLYEEEQKTLFLFKLFSAIAILIGCLGLFGLISFTINQRTKEIGIRKVLGAKIGQLVYLISKEFLLLVSIAFGLTLFPAWYFMSEWLAGFAYNIPLTWWHFVVPFLLTVIITLVTIGFRAMKAALMNPVQALRDD